MSDLELNFDSTDGWLARSSFVLNAPMSAEQRELQAQRRQLLKTYRSIMVRLDVHRCEFSPQTRRELDVLKERLERCALDAPDTFRELLDDLSEFQKEIQSALDKQDEGRSSKRPRDARVAASVGSSKSLKSAATFEAPTSGGSGSDRSDMELHNDAAPGVSTTSPLSAEQEPQAEAPQPAAKRSSAGPARGAGSAPKRRRRRGDGEEWAAPEDAAHQHFTHYVLYTLVFKQPPTSNANLQTRTGGWKCDDFVQRYTEEFPNRATPKNFWSNSAIPAGLEVCWRRAKGLMAQHPSLGDSGVKDCIRRLAGLEPGCDPWAGSVLQVRPSRPPVGPTRPNNNH